MRHPRLPSPADKALLGVLSAGLAWLVWQGGQLIAADLQALAARTNVRAWADGSGAWTVRQWVAARDDTLAAMARTPADPALYDQLGVIYLVRARDAWRSPAGQRELYAEAARLQRQSLALRPGHGWTWAALAESLQVLEPGSDTAWNAWRQALRLAPHERSVQSTLFRIGLSQWARTPIDVAAWMQASRLQAEPEPREAMDQMAKRYGIRVDAGGLLR